MSTCKGCAEPDRGIIIASCRACQLRDIALGPWFFQSMRTGKLSPEYMTQLKALGDIKAVHEEVKAAAKSTHTGAVG